MIALAGQFVAINGEIGTLSTDVDELLFSDVLISLASSSSLLKLPNLTTTHGNENVKNQ